MYLARQQIYRHQFYIYFEEWFSYFDMLLIMSLYGMNHAQVYCIYRYINVSSICNVYRPLEGAVLGAVLGDISQGRRDISPIYIL